MSQSRQLAAIMFTDIVGYTALMGEDEQKAFELLKKNRKVQRPIIEKYNGRWIKEIGDGVLASFATVSDAVYCAKEIQDTCQNESDLILRIGIHLGEVVFEGNDVFGDGVNIASRLESLAPIGGILVSESVNRNLGNKKGIETNFVREETLKNVKDPIKVYTVKVAGVESPGTIRTKVETPIVQVAKSKSINARKIGFSSLAIIFALFLVYFFYSQQSEDEPQTVQSEIIDKSIAVLPFKNDSPDSDNQYFCDGMMDEILNHLQKIAELGVKSRTAVEPYRETNLSFAAIAQELEVAFVLEGAVRKYGNRFRVTTQLIDVASGNHLWSEVYDGVFSDTIFVVQSNIAKKIAASLNTVITPDEEESIDRIPTTDIAAYDLYIRANHERLLYLGTREDKHLQLAYDLFDKALEIDPNYLLAIVGKGQALNAEFKTDSAFIYADRAIALDPKFNRAYGLKGYCYSIKGIPDLAMEYFLKAINLTPKDDWWYHYHTAIGQEFVNMENDVIKALPYFKKGIEKGENQYVAAGYISLAFAYLNIGDYERAEQYNRESPDCWELYGNSRLMNVQGKFQEALQFADSRCQKIECKLYCSLVLFEASLLLGEFEKAEQYFYQYQDTRQESWLITSRYWDYQIGYVYHKLGRTEEAEKIFTEQIQKLQPELNKGLPLEGKWISYLHLARIYAFQGDRNKALKHLSKYAELGFTAGWHDFILIDPFFESLWDDPEFKAIVKQAQEEKAALRVQVREMEERGELDL